MTRALILVGAVALTIAMVASAGAASSRVYYELPFGQVKYKPRTIEFNDLTLSKLHYRHWGRKAAWGSGRTRVNTCNPNCAGGTIEHGTVHLKLYKRHTEGSRRLYGCMKGTTKTNGHKEHVEWPPGCAG